MGDSAISIFDPDTKFLYEETMENTYNPLAIDFRGFGSMKNSLHELEKLYAEPYELPEYLQQNRRDARNIIDYIEKNNISETIALKRYKDDNIFHVICFGEKE